MNELYELRAIVSASHTWEKNTLIDIVNIFICSECGMYGFEISFISDKIIAENPTTSCSEYLINKVIR